ncbi:MAG: hypothetical protein BroJett040_05580 [Oligoflexia bacterium]|nr:MAG: hypothetical protein BroJett040_05580 [Oligoflexia bacterium]
MIYGRRFNKKSKGFPARPTASPFQLKFTHRRFQWKYTLFFISIVLGAILLFAGPTWYFVSQNYQIFTKLAFDSNPQLVQYLEREIVWLGAFLTISATVTVILSAMIGLRMTGNLVRPLIKMERHMRQISVGDWSSQDFRHANHEDFYELLDTYSYMYRSLRAHTESEIKLLEKLVIDPQNGEAVAIWKALINNKRSQLNQLPSEPPLNDTTNEISAESFEADSQHRAS